MKKKLIITAIILLISSLLVVSVIHTSAAVYVQDGKFKFQLYEDGTAAWAGYISDTADDVIVPRFYDDSTVIGVANFGLQNNSSVKTVDFMEAPDLSSIGMYAFSGCTSLESIVIPGSITSVGVSAFRNCSSLKNVEYYGNNNSVSIEAFYGCSSLESVRLSARLNAIQSRAFAGCSSLKYIELYDTVNYIASNAFDGCDNLTIGCFKNTYVHNYCVENGLDFYLIDGDADYAQGDVNRDTVVDVTDVTVVQQYAALLVEFDEQQLALGDMNGDNVVDISDATAIQRLAAGLQ